ncbi:hypothetical protein JHK85_010558 [Glycine max]|nr:hypothetical protein JHK85_010558 [Glycine max]
MATTEEKCFQEMATVEQKIQFRVETELNQNASEFNVASMATSLSTPPEAKCVKMVWMKTIKTLEAKDEDLDQDDS